LAALSRFRVVGACVSIFLYLSLDVTCMGYASSLFVFPAFLWRLYEDSKSGKHVFY